MVFQGTEELLTTRNSKDLEALKAMRKRIQALLPRYERSLGKTHPNTLLLRGASGSLRARLGEERYGYAAYAHAAGELHRSALEMERASTPNFAGLAARYEGLGALLRLEGLQDLRWREEALRVKLRMARDPDPALENDCIAAIGEAYGGWLSFRPPDLPKVLEFSHALCRLWLLRKEDRALTETVVQQAITSRGGVGGVWHLVANNGDETLRLHLEDLLNKLDAGTLLSGYPSILQWASNLSDSPLWNATDKVLERVEATLEKKLNKDGNPDRLKLANLALARKRPDRAADQLRMGLEESTNPRAALDLFPAIFATPSHLEDSRLRKALLTCIREILDSQPDVNMASSLGSWAESLEARGWWAEAEALRRTLAEAQPPATTPGAEPAGDENPRALGKLAWNLFMQGKLDEAAHVCSRWWTRAGAQPEAALLSARIEMRRGAPNLARDYARRAFQAMAQGSEDLWRMGGYSELWVLFQDQQGDEELRAQVAAEAQRRIAPEGQVPQGLLKEPLRMLQALDPALQESERKTDTLDPLSRAALLMAKAKEGNSTERAARIEEALHLTEKALGSDHPALLPILETWVKEGFSDDLAHAVDPLRRAVAITQAHPELGADVALRMKTYLGFALTMGQDSSEGEEMLLETLRHYGELSPRQGEDPFNDLCNFVDELTGFHLGRERYLDAAEWLRIAREIPFPEQAEADLERVRKGWTEREQTLRRMARVQTFLRAQGLP